MKNRSWKRGIGTFLTVIIAAGAIYSAYFFFSTVRALVAQSPLPFAERVVRAADPSSVDDQGDELSGEPSEISLPTRELTERINILLLGIDQREGETGPWRSDTMILVSLDPVSKTAAMLSIPRDLWTTIPGYGESRINTAHFTGDARDYPGGGPALAKKTVWYALGVPVHNYVRVDFAGFEQIVEAIGGLTINVPEPIRDSKYPTSDYGVMEVYFPAGVQDMDGETALQYARTRHGGNDFDRMARQRQVLFAAFDKALRLDIPLTRIPRILDLLGSSVQTDLSLEEILILADAVRQINREDIQQAAIDSSMTTTVVTPQGWMVEVADWEKVRSLVDDLFPMTSTLTEPMAAASVDQVASEDARIALYNGTVTPMLAQMVTAVLREEGFAVVSYDNADRFDHTQTLIVAYREKPYTLVALAHELGVDPDTIVYKKDPGETVDIAVILGRDYVQGVHER